MTKTLYILFLSALCLWACSCQEETDPPIEAPGDIAPPPLEQTGGEKIPVSDKTQEEMAKEAVRLAGLADLNRKQSPLKEKDCDEILAIYREENARLYKTGKRTALLDSMVKDVIYDSCRQIHNRHFERIDDSLQSIYAK